jgi:hypothetical protein
MTARRPHRFFICLSCLAVLLLGACEKGLQWRIPPQILEPVPFTPLETTPGVQTVYLRAFLSNIAAVDSITLSQGFHTRWAKGMDTVLLRTDNNAPAMGAMQFWSGGYAYTLPLIRQFSRDMTFTLADSGQRHTAVSLVTSFSEPRAMVYSSGSWTFKARVPEGLHAYGYQIDAARIQPDPLCADSIFWPGLGMFSVVPADPIKGELNACRTLAYTGTQVRLSRDPQAASVLVLWNNIEIPFDTADGALRLEIPKAAQKVPVSYLRVWSYNQKRILGSCKIPLVKGKIPVDTGSLPAELWEAALRYELMTDRFHNGDQSNDRKLNTRGLLHPKLDFHGGDFAGIAAKIKEGYFRELGINFLHISPPARNLGDVFLSPEDPNGIRAAYDGRQPVGLVETEPGFGSTGAFRLLTEQAKAAGLTLGLEPPLRRSVHAAEGHAFEPDSAWFWFRSFNAAAWMSNAETMSAKEAALVASGLRSFGKEENGRNVLPAMDGNRTGSAVSASMRASVLAFNAPSFYALAFSAFAFNGGGIKAAEHLSRYLYALQDLQIRFHSTGNEWLPRFISLADGSLNPSRDENLAGWNTDIQNKGEAYFGRLQGLFALCCALPGIPGLYYGDEIAMPGGAPPDNHRDMRFEGLSSVQTDHRDAIARLAKFRQTHPVLMFGDIRVFPSTPGIIIIERNYFGRSIFAVFNLQNQVVPLRIPKPLSKSFQGARLQTGNDQVSFKLEPHTYDFIY